MLPGQTSLKTIRDAQRARSLGLNAQQRQYRDLCSVARNASATSPSSSGSGSKLAPRQRTQGVWRGVQSAAGKKAIEQEVLEGKGLAELEVGLGGADSKAGAAEEEEGEEIENRVPEKGAVEVPLEELAVRPARGRHVSGDFELIRHVKGVIALDLEEEFGAASSAELGIAIEDHQEDDWELLGLDDEEEGALVKEVKPQGKSWASIVGRS